MTHKSTKFAVVISCVGVGIALLFLIMSYFTNYPLFLPVSVFVGNVLILIGNYIRFIKVRKTVEQ